MTSHYLQHWKRRNCTPLLNVIFKKHLVAFVIYISFLSKHNPSFTLFLICSYYLPNLSFDVLMKCICFLCLKKCYCKNTKMRFLWHQDNGNRDCVSLLWYYCYEWTFDWQLPQTWLNQVSNNQLVTRKIK